MLPETFQFIIAMIVYAIDERMARQAECLQEEVWVLEEALVTATGKTPIDFTAEQRRRLAGETRARTRRGLPSAATCQQVASGISVMLTWQGQSGSGGPIGTSRRTRERTGRRCRATIAPVRLQLAFESSAGMAGAPMPFTSARRTASTTRLRFATAASAFVALTSTECDMHQRWSNQFSLSKGGGSSTRRGLADRHRSIGRHAQKQHDRLSAGSPGSRLLSFVSRSVGCALQSPTSLRQSAGVVCISCRAQGAKK